MIEFNAKGVGRRDEWTLANPGLGHPALADPWQQALEFGPGTVMALLVETRGPAYRDAGTAMAIAADGRFAGAISAGCIEADLFLQAAETRRDGRPRLLHYGAGSPFGDLRLPCGGAIWVRLFTLPDPGTLLELARARAARRRVALHVSEQGRLRVGPYRPSGLEGRDFCIGFRPAPRFVTFGAGPEVAVFAALVQGLGYPQLLLSHEEASLAAARALGCDVRELHDASGLGAVSLDADSAAVLFYHDHDHEPGILRQLLAGPAFYVGAQGSRAAQANRLARLGDLGVPADQLARLRGPIGLVPSARDPRTLAVSVLAEVMAAFQGAAA